MCRPSRWWLGLAPLAALFLVALFLRTPHVEADVAANARAAIDREGVIDPAVVVAGRDVKLAGLVAGDDAKARDAALAAAGVRKVEDGLKPLPVKTPYAVGFARAADGVTVTGFAPAPAVRAALVQAAGALGKATDKMTYAAGAPQGFEAMATTALAALAPLTEGTAHVSDGALTVTGQAPSVAAYEKSLAAASSQAAGLKLAKFEVSAPDVSPYLFSARRDGPTLRLSGYAPDAAAKARLLDVARRSAPQVEDRLRVAGGAPQGFEAMATTALAALAPLAKGEFDLTGASLAISGEAADRMSYDGARAALAAKPAGLTIARAEIAPPPPRPYPFAVTKHGARLTLAGAAPDEATRARLTAAARATGAAVDDSLVAARGAGPHFEAQALAAIAAVIPLERGEAALSDAVARLTGEAPDALARDKAVAALNAPGLTVGAVDVATAEGGAIDARRDGRAAILSGQVPDAPAAPQTAAAPAKPVDPAAAACHAQILEKLAEETIEFSTGSARLAPKSMALIGRLANIIKGCPDADLEVAGHTDNVGDPNHNLTLSRNRAEAVVNALKAAGAPADRLSWAGYGETKPVASNESAEGRARNRRIEFVLK